MQHEASVRPKFVLEVSTLGCLTSILAVLVATLAFGQGATIAAAAPSAGPAGARTPAAPAWVGTVTSPNDAGRRLAPITFSDAMPTDRITVDLGELRQRWIGVGGTLTDPSVELLASNQEAFNLLFATDIDGGARLNLVRLPLSATDFSDSAWTWTSKGSQFRPTSQARRAVRMIADIVAEQADASVIATGWTAPGSMLTADGALSVDSEADYAGLLDTQVGWLRTQAVPISAVTLGNEPGHIAEYPSMTMTDDQMVRLGEMVKPSLVRRDVDLWAVDHNWADRPRVDALLEASPGTFDAAAFHCYEGSPDQMAGLAVPAVITECTGTTDNWTSTFGWDSRVLVAESIRAGSTGLMMWNLALTTQPSVLPGGCFDCRGLLTFDPTSGQATPTPEYFTVAHVARAADPGAVVLTTDHLDGLPTVAFLNPDGTVGIFGHNDTAASRVIEFVQSSGTTVTVEVGAWEMFSIRG